MLAHYPDNFDDLANLGVGDPRWDGMTALHGAVHFQPALDPAVSGGPRAQIRCQKPARLDAADHHQGHLHGQLEERIPRGGEDPREGDGSKRRQPRITVLRNLATAIHPHKDRTASVRGVRRRLGAGCDGRPALQFRHPDADRDLGHHAGPGRRAGNGGAAGIGRGRMAGWVAGGSLRPRADAASGDPVVRGLHVSFRPGAELRAVIRRARPDGTGIRRRMGGRRSSAGRGHPAGASRQGSGNDAGRVGRGMGRRRAALRPVLFLAAA